MSRIINVKLSPEAYSELDRLAREAGLPLNEFCLRLMMTHPDVDRSDLAVVPRLAMGRPRKPVTSQSA